MCEKTWPDCDHHELAWLIDYGICFCWWETGLWDPSQQSVLRRHSKSTRVTEWNEAHFSFTTFVRQPKNQGQYFPVPTINPNDQLAAPGSAIAIINLGLHITVTSFFSSILMSFLHNLYSFFFYITCRAQHSMIPL